MGYWLDNTIEVTYNGKTTRVAKQDAHLYSDSKKVSKKKEEKPKEDK